MAKLIAGNWKMNGTGADLAGFIGAVAAGLPALAGRVDLAVCVPATLIERFARAAKDIALPVGGQDCHAAASGAHTGDISVAMLADAGARYCIVGHSERRADHGETDAGVKAKATALLAGGLMPIVCIGETLEERKAGRTLDVVKASLLASLPDNGEVVVAYEPVWAIGTGLTPTAAEIAEVHALLRQLAGPSVRLLYGGSVKPGNAAEIMALPDVDGALVGGASLKAADFLGIAEGCPR